MTTTHKRAVSPHDIVLELVHRNCVIVAGFFRLHCGSSYYESKYSYTTASHSLVHAEGRVLGGVLLTFTCDIILLTATTGAPPFSVEDTATPSQLWTLQTWYLPSSQCCLAKASGSFPDWTRQQKNWCGPVKETHLMCNHNPGDDSIVIRSRESIEDHFVTKKAVLKFFSMIFSNQYYTKRWM